MLDEYFMMKLSREHDGGDGGSGKAGASEGEALLRLSSLPLLLEGHSPVPEALPTFLLRLATEVRVKQQERRWRWRR